MTTKFVMTRDYNGFNGFGVVFTDTGASTTLAANVAQSDTVPGPTTCTPNGRSKLLAVFSYTPGSNIWVANGATAAVPGSSFSATTSQLNPACREVNSGDVLSFITSDTNSPQVGVSYYVAPPFTN